MKNENGRAVAALVLLTLVWGYNWIVAKEALRYAGPFHVGLYRMVIGVAVLLAAVVLQRRWPRFPAPWKTACIGLFQTAGFVLFSNWALVEGGAGKTAVLVYTMPMWTLALSHLLLHERIGRAQWGAALSALVGLLFIISPWRLTSSLFSDVLALLSALSWGLSTVLVKRWRADLGADVLTLTTWQMVLGLVPLALAAWLVPERPTEWTLDFGLILAFMAVIGTAVGWFLWLYVLERLPAWQAGLSVLGIPVVAIVASRLQLGERVAADEVFGMVLIGAGLLALSLVSRQAQGRTDG